MFSTSSQTVVTSSACLQFQLMDMRKGSKSVDEYLLHAKQISNALAAINKPVDPEYLVTAILRGLGPEYHMLRTAIIQTPPLPTFNDLYAHILAFEAQDPHLTNSSPSHTAGFTNHLPPPLSHQSSNPSGGKRHNWFNNNRNNFHCGSNHRNNN